MEECKLCGGSGFISWTDESGISRAKACECRAKMITESRLRASGISEAFQKRTIEGFSDKGNSDLANAKDKAIEYIDSFKQIESSMNNSIMFLGNPGSGKTHLSLAIANKLLNEHGVGCLYFSYREAITEIKQLVADRDSKYRYEDLMHKYKNARLLIIDDLYKGSVTEADLNYVFQIINYRYLNQKPFILSSERLSGQLLDIDEAIGSRLLEQAKGRVVQISGRYSNYRIYS